MIEGEHASFGHRGAPVATDPAPDRAAEDEIVRRIMAENRAQAEQDDAEARAWGRRFWSLADWKLAGLGGPPPWLQRLGYGFLSFVAIAAFRLFTIDAVNSTPPPGPLDLAPGTQLALGPWQPPAGCPTTSWKQADHLPRACLTGTLLSDDTASVAGLQRPAHRRSGWQHWARADHDALLTFCSILFGCRVVRVVPDKFSD